MDDCHDGFARKQRRVVNHAIVNAGREVFLEFRQLRPHRVGSLDGVRPRQLPNYKRCGGLAAELRSHRVVARGKFSSRHVADARDLTLRPLFDDDFAELLFVEQTSLSADRELKILAGGYGRLTNRAGRHLKILFADGADDIAGRHVARGEFFRVEPDAHRIIAGPEHGYISDTLDAGELILHLEEGVVTEVEFVARTIRRDQMRYHG